MTMASLPRQIASCASAAALSLAELVWPTRCAACDAPGQLLCDRCRNALPYIDPLLACPRCGAPYGAVQCSECNRATLQHRGYERYPLDGQVSAVSFDDASARIVRTWKDAGERALSAVIGTFVARSVPPSWIQRSPVVVAVPASPNAYRRRGFDHGFELASDVAERLGLSCAALLDRPRAKDQRNLTGAQRASNMQGRFKIAPGIAFLHRPPRAVLLVDDVCTTGSTLFSAAEALRLWGAEELYAATFARVW